VERHAFVDTHLSGTDVDFDAAKIEDEAVGRRAVDLVHLVEAARLGGVQNTVSRKAAALSSGSMPGDQWLAAAARAKFSPFSGFLSAKARP
jgi:hypothetical protein